ncbi:MAG: tRNA pseudouridine(55) synthase TruB [Chlamydiota bacterium]
MKNNSGILLVDKEIGSTSFRLVSLLRRITKLEKIGHAGTLDPFATGVMVMLVGREFTRRSDEFLNSDKQYRAVLRLGITTDSYDREGAVIQTSEIVPESSQVESALRAFQGEILQTPPMFSAKKMGGQKLCDLARRGITIDRPAVKVVLQTTLLRYEYPDLEIEVSCSKGTYIRSVAHDLGQMLGCGAHLISLTRLRSGPFLLADCLPQHLLKNPEFDVSPYLKTML